VFTYQSFYADTGMHGVYVATGPSTAAAALDAIRNELAEVATHGLPAQEIAMGQQQLKGQITLSLESVSARMYRAATVVLYNEPYRSLDELLALVDAITPEQVSDVAREFFDPNRMTVMSLGPVAV
jgi:predicted Zn-dependent peptidase